ncbi:MAG: hypothetical protein R3290_12430 [Acidimicrobiia bacterium]|nr:hypothetical protein [Acidimicrobiia bacterium]
MTIAVVHIHKTAGTTLASVFKHSHGARHCDVLTVPDEAVFGADEYRRMRRLYPRLESLLGHALRAYSDLDEAIPDLRYMTFLREPLARTASHYQYDIQRGHVDLPFDEWITHDAVRDRMTRHLAGPDAAADDGIAVLDRMSFVGRQDRFDESLVLMQRMLGVPDVRYASKWVAPSNDIKRRLLADPRTRAMLEEVNRDDLAVWEHAVTEIYPKQLAQHGDEVDDAVAALRSENESMTVRRMYRSPRYTAYVAKWRLLYRPWIRRRLARLDD